MTQPPGPPLWLLLVHQLPPRPTNPRVKTWRRLQDLGAVALKNAVYVLPNTDACREDFEWIKSEIQAMRGEATVFTAHSIDSVSNDEVVAAFRKAREASYAALQRDAEALAASAGRKAPRGPRHQSRARDLRQLRRRLDDLDAIAFYPPANRESAAASVARAEREAVGAGKPQSPDGDRLDAAKYARRTWVTRPRPGVDRMSSAWLIRRFLDPKARFAFATTPPASGQAVAFDMYGVEFSHTAHGCTYETLVARFGLSSPAVDRIGRIVHDLDLKESKYQEPDAPAIGHLIDGLRQLHADDGELLERGIGMFEALYLAFGSDGGARARRARARRR